MASTVTLDTQPHGRTASGDRLIRRGTVTLGTYATNGIAVTASQFEMGVLTDLAVYPAGGYVPRWDKSAGKVLVYLNKDPAAAGGADLALPELGAVDISATSFRFKAEGQ